MKLSVCIITLNEEANIGRTLKSVQPLVLQKDDADGPWGEIIVVDSGSTDKTVEIAKSFGAKVFTEPWKGFAAQKNSALEKAQGEWVLSLDADEEVDERLVQALPVTIKFGASYPSAAVWKAVSGVSGFGVSMKPGCQGYWIPRKNYFLHRWIGHGGFFPDKKMRLFRRESGTFEVRKVHEDAKVNGPKSALPEEWGSLLHHAYPTLSGYIEHMNKYSSLGAEMEVEKGRRGFSLINIVLRPWLTFIYNYVFRLGFLDGKEGLLLHLYHAVYVSWKYAKVWELSRSQSESNKDAAS